MRSKLATKSKNGTIFNAKTSVSIRAAGQNITLILVKTKIGCKHWLLRKKLHGKFINKTEHPPLGLYIFDLHTQLKH